MKIIVEVSKGRLCIGGAVFPITNAVRTLGGGTRKRSEVIRSIPDNLPYDPRGFPKGLWRVTAVEWQEDRGFDPLTYGQVKIRTDAWQWVKVWDLDADGDYLRETDKTVKDSGYLIHYSPYKTTLGCIRAGSAEDAVMMAKIIEPLLKENGPVDVEVV
jgi:hypothetical protein